MTPCLRSPTRMRRIFDLDTLPVTWILSVGIKGMPRQVRKGLPKRVTVGGGTPRRVHSRPKAAIVRGCARKKDGSFHTFVNNSARASGVGEPLRVEIFCESGTLLSSP